MKHTATLTLSAMLLSWAPLTVPAQEGAPPPPPPDQSENGGPGRPPKGSGEGPGPEHGRDRGEDRERMRGGRGGRGDFLRNLNEDERQKVRAAFDAAWKHPQVIAAREELSQANEKFRQTMDRALAEIDPEVPAILERARPREGPPPMLSQMPAIETPDFTQAAVDQFSKDLQAWARIGPDDKARLQALHQKILQQSQVQEQIKILTDATTEQKKEAWEKLRDAYQQTAKDELNKSRPAPRGPGGGPPPSWPRAHPNESTQPAGPPPPPPAPPSPL